MPHHLPRGKCISAELHAPYDSRRNNDGRPAPHTSLQCPGSEASCADPDEAAVIRLIGAVLADTRDEWATDERRYLSEASMAKLHPDRDTDTVTTIEGSDR